MHKIQKLFIMSESEQGIGGNILIHRSNMQLQGSNERNPQTNYPQNLARAHKMFRPRATWPLKMLVHPLQYQMKSY